MGFFYHHAGAQLAGHTCTCGKCRCLLGLPSGHIQFRRKLDIRQVQALQTLRETQHLDLQGLMMPFKDGFGQTPALAAGASVIKLPLACLAFIALAVFLV